MALRFNFSDPTRRIAVLFLTSNKLVNKSSDFLELGFLAVVWVIGKLGLSSVISYGVETIAASRISLIFIGPHTYQHVDIYLLCYSNICVQKKPCCALIDQYQ